MRKIACLFFILGLLQGTAYGFDDLVTGASAHYGFIIQHRNSMQHLITGHTRGFEFDFAKQTHGEKNWHVVYKYPLYGVKFYYADLGNPKVMGDATGIIPYISLPFVNGKIIYFGFTVGTGFGYITKAFNATDNYKNIAIGSRINGIMHGELESHVAISHNTKITAGVALTHFSNGAFKIPNLGINVPTLSAGILYSLNSSPYSSPPDSLIKQEPVNGKKFSYRVIVTGGLKEIPPIGGKKYPVYSLSNFFLYSLNRKSSIGLGADIFYHSSLRQLQSDSTGKLAPFTKAVRVGLFFPYELKISRFSIALQVGAYVLDSYHKDGSIYQRVGFHYKVSEHLLLNYTLKLHFGKADNLELGLGYSF